MVATSAEWGATERAQRADVSADLQFALIRGTKRATRGRTVPIVSRDQRSLLQFADLLRRRRVLHPGPVRSPCFPRG
jgi:hypothetical protein